MTFLIDQGIISDSQFLSVTATLTYPNGKLAFINTRGQYTEGDKVMVVPGNVVLMIETRTGKRFVDSPVISSNIGRARLVLISSYSDSFAIVMSFSLERDSLARVIASADFTNGYVDCWIRFGIPVLVNHCETHSFHEECTAFTERIQISITNKRMSVIAFENFGARFDVDADATRFGLFDDLENNSQPTSQP
jgi:hypothetical protein